MLLALVATAPSALARAATDATHVTLLPGAGASVTQLPHVHGSSVRPGPEGLEVTTAVLESGRVLSAGGYDSGWSLRLQASLWTASGTRLPEGSLSASSAQVGALVLDSGDGAEIQRQGRDSLGEFDGAKPLLLRVVSPKGQTSSGVVTLTLSSGQL